MSAEPTPSRGSFGGRVAGLLRRTRFAIRASLGRRDGQATLGVVATVYVLLYAIGLNHLGWRAGASTGATDEPFFDLFVVADPLSAATTRVAPFQYETVALVTVGPVEYLFSPVNATVGILLGVLVGVTMAVSVVAWRGPSACRIGTGAGAAAGVPGLLSGFVCCGPTILLVIGVQASAGLLAAMQWFLPLAVVALLATLLWVGSQVDPEAV